MLTAKKLVNDPDNAVEEAIDGLPICNPTLVHLNGTRAVIRRGFSGENKVALLCGGGSGHEPAHVGYVGRPMLSAVVPGLVFTSLPPRDDRRARLAHVRHPASSSLHGRSTEFPLGCRTSESAGVVIVYERNPPGGKVSAELFSCARFLIWL